MLESRDYTSDSTRRRATSLLMPLELESYLNVPRISEIEPFPAACVPGTVYIRHFVRWPHPEWSIARRSTLSQMRNDHFSYLATSRQAACGNFL